MTARSINISNIPVWVNAIFFYGFNLKTSVFSPLPSKTDRDSEGWEYQKRNRPSWTPPGWVFGIMWPLFVFGTRAVTAAVMVQKLGCYANVPIMALMLNLSFGNLWNTMYVQTQQSRKDAFYFSHSLSLLFVNQKQCGSSLRCLCSNAVRVGLDQDMGCVPVLSCRSLGREMVGRNFDLADGGCRPRNKHLANQSRPRYGQTGALVSCQEGQMEDSLSMGVRYAIIESTKLD
eukprot:scaffold276_cov132-Cylindrotheca_fusiformis.AAC.1